MVKGGGRGDGEVISAIPIMLRIDPVQGKTHDGQDIGSDGGLGPGGIDLAGCHIFDVVPVGNIIVFRIAVGRPVMYYNGLGNHHAA